MTQTELKKIVYLLKKLYNSDRNRKWMSEILTYSRFIFKPHWKQRSIENLFDLNIYLDHEIFLKHISQNKTICSLIKDDLHLISEILINKIIISPDYEKMAISGSEIHPIYTEWEEINIGQQKLIEQLERSSDSIDFQNIGNSSRNILEKLANEVFKPGVHQSRDINIDTSPGKYKNQLHSYIKFKLSGTENKELRQFMESAITMIEKCVNLANSLTHKIDAERTLGEVCVVSTISAISIIKLLEKS